MLSVVLVSNILQYAVGSQLLFLHPKKQKGPPRKTLFLGPIVIEIVGSPGKICLGENMFENNSPHTEKQNGPYRRAQVLPGGPMRALDYARHE